MFGSLGKRVMGQVPGFGAGKCVDVDYVVVRHETSFERLF